MTDEESKKKELEADIILKSERVPKNMCEYFDCINRAGEGGFCNMHTEKDIKHKERRPA